ncbi:MAG: nucleoside deaminase [Alphaproteobacteria bacterium]|nr:nucleoside deaminase [Alphaproteobacteria bacterium]
MAEKTSSFFEAAQRQAEEAGKRGEVPVGAVLVDSRTNAPLAAFGNRIEELSDPTAHAELLCIREGASRLGNARLSFCDLYVTLEPCAMCASAIAFARIRRLYFGAYDPKGGGVDHGPCIFEQPTCHHRPEVYGGIDEERCKSLLTDFFAERREKKA